MFVRALQPLGANEELLGNITILLSLMLLEGPRDY